jgi:hypothetical protein
MDMMFSKKKNELYSKGLNDLLAMARDTYKATIKLADVK